MSEQPARVEVSLEERVSRLETELSAIQARNLRVEQDKTWELSAARRLTIASITYLVAAVLLRLIGSESYLFNALVPTAGYVLSTLTLPWAKARWCKR